VIGKKEADMPDINCRVAKLEEKHETLLETVKRMDDNVDKLVALQEKQKGYIGGVTMTISAIIGIGTWWFNKQ
jgi:hypothetical protein